MKNQQLQANRHAPIHSWLRLKPLQMIAEKTTDKINNTYHVFCQVFDDTQYT